MKFRVVTILVDVCIQIVDRKYLQIYITPRRAVELSRMSWCRKLRYRLRASLLFAGSDCGGEALENEGDP